MELWAHACSDEATESLPRRCRGAATVVALVLVNGPSPPHRGGRQQSNKTVVLRELSAAAVVDELVAAAALYFLVHISFSTLLIGVHSLVHTLHRHPCCN